ncbi:MFS transporter [Labilibaculum euxinus]|uniref:MFS transporter n=1 Tax=Labilibaculum euxinus TaxID=2686357 RepID=A0A7M4D4Y1_9BACT|nr:MFS transporter [Labilibaculum euxinus]MUP37710.1 MFS transporter [Labilibaculum euxinus]MVB06915.1 MFS transporter [Labilibaculum euxinus]
MSSTSVFKKFPKTFWVANSIELFERWAWYGFFMLFANYLTGSSDAGGLEFTQVQKGMIMGIGTGILYFLPILTGSIADKYGYKKVLFLAFIIYTSAFILLPMFDTFTGVFIMYLYLALGAALFKPIISATIAKTTTDETASIGFGIFYMMVNIGAFFGPMVTLLFKNSSYNLVFYISAGIVALNFILLLFYKEPNRKPNNDTLGVSIANVFKNIGLVVVDLKFMLFLLIIAGFWTMYNQLFFTLPVFIAQWVDTSVVFNFFHNTIPFFSENYGTHNGQMEAEFITNFDALFIIIFQLIVSTIVMKWQPLKTMMTGFLVCAIGMSLTLFTQNVLFTFAAIYIFAIGEMAGSPKITEYIGRIAPADKKALYMGYSFIPVFLGNVFAGFISGNVYQDMSDKTLFVKQEVAKRGLEISESLSQNEYFNRAAESMSMTPNELTNYLWSSYNPSKIWYVILAIGLFAVLALYFYDRLLLNKKA